MLLLPLVAAPLSHLYTSTCCSTTASVLLLQTPRAPLHMTCCFHLLQHHCIVPVGPPCDGIFSVASIYCTTTYSSMFPGITVASALLLPPAPPAPPAAAPLHLPCCLHHLQHHCISSDGCTICSTTVISLLLLPARLRQHHALHLLCCFHMLQHRCICSAVDTCCSTSASTLLLPPAAAPLQSDL